jgi:hypothetical protein
MSSAGRLNSTAPASRDSKKPVKAGRPLFFYASTQEIIEREAGKRFSRPDSRLEETKKKFDKIIGQSQEGT